MVYKAKIDTAYYCDLNGRYTPDGIARLRRDTENAFTELAEMRPSVTAGVCVYKGRINEKLQERSREAYNDIVAVIGESAYSGTARYDEELTRFACTASIYRLEEGAVEKTIYDHIQYIDDFMEIYNLLFCVLSCINTYLTYNIYTTKKLIYQTNKSLPNLPHEA